METEDDYFVQALIDSYAPASAKAAAAPKTQPRTQFNLDLQKLANAEFTDKNKSTYSYKKSEQIFESGGNPTLAEPETDCDTEEEICYRESVTSASEYEAVTSNSVIAGMNVAIVLRNQSLLRSLAYLLYGNQEFFKTVQDECERFLVCRNLTSDLTMGI